MRPLLFMAWVVGSSLASVEFWSDGSSTGDRSCTVDELLPRTLTADGSVSAEWSGGTVTQPPYGCDCTFYRARCDKSWPCLWFASACTCFLLKGASTVARKKTTLPKANPAAFCILIDVILRGEHGA